MFSLVGISLALSYFVVNAGRLGDLEIYGTFLRYLGVLALGILAYTALFTFLGALLKRAIIVGLIFGFGWENVIQYFPGSTQRFSIVHYLKSLLPYHPAASGLASGGRGVALLLFRLEPTRPAMAIVALAAITAALLALACWLFRAKEYLYED
jgi:ABC-2 type transport system permease protein